MYLYFEYLYLLVVVISAVLLLLKITKITRKQTVPYSNKWDICLTTNNGYGKQVTFI